MKKSIIRLLYVLLLVFLCKAAVQERYPDVPYVPTPYEVVEEMLRLADVGKDDVVYDLGCGDGRIVIMAAEKMGARAVGIDIDPKRIKESRENAISAKVTNRVRFLQQDFFVADIGEATVVTLYLTTDVNRRIRPKLLRELKPGTRIVSNEFSMGEWEPENISKINIDYDNYTVYYWVVPANVTGTWKWTIPLDPDKKRYVLEVVQQFQKVKGTVTVGDSKVFIENAKLEGDRLQFTIDQEVKGKMMTVLFEGKVSGHSINGIADLKSGSSVERYKWKAKRDPLTRIPLDRSDSYQKCPKRP